MVRGDILLAARHGSSISGVRAGTDAHSFRVNPLILEKPRQVWPFPFLHSTGLKSRLRRQQWWEQRTTALGHVRAGGGVLISQNWNSKFRKKMVPLLYAYREKNCVTLFKMLKIKVSSMLEWMVKKKPLTRQAIKFFVHKLQLSQQQIKILLHSCDCCNHTVPQSRYPCQFPLSEIACYITTISNSISQNTTQIFESTFCWWESL